MSIDWNFALAYIPVVALILCLWLLVWQLMFGLHYLVAIIRSKTPAKFPDLTIPIEVTGLISRLGRNVKIRVVDSPLFIPGAVSYYALPAFVIFPKQLLHQDPSTPSQLSTNDIVAVTAHELGHIIPKNRAVWLIFFAWTGLMLSFGWCLGAVGQSSVMSFIASIVTFAALRAWLNSLSHADEERADSFAVLQAGIPSTQLIHALAQVERYFAKLKEANFRWWEFLVESAFAALIDSHPSTEQRILRIRELYGGE